MTRRLTHRIGTFTLLAALTASAACGSDGNDSNTGATGGADLSGTIRIDGSSTVGPLSEAAAELFKEENNGVQVTVGTSGTGGGFKKFCSGETDIADASREIKDEEKAACAANGIEFDEFTIANDGIALVVNKENTWAKCLTVEQVKAVWDAESDIDNWKQVDPKFPSVQMRLFGAGTDSGTFDFFTKAINGEEKRSRTDFNATEDDNTTVTGVSGEKGGLGFFGLSYYEQNEDKLAVVKVDGGEGCVAPSAETVQDGSYKPLSPAAVHLRQQEGAGPGRGQGFHRVLHREHRRHRRAGVVHPAHVEPAVGARSQARRAPGAVALAATTPVLSPTTPAASPLGSSRARWGERVVRAALMACALLSVVTTLGIVIALLQPTVEFFSEVSIREFFTGKVWAPLFASAKFGVLPLVTATFVVTAVALSVCVPLGLGAAVYLSEYSSRRARRILKPMLEVLAGIPTVVYGFFALTFVTPLLRDIWPLGDPPDIFNALSAGLVMGVMILPTMASLAEDAMRAVPDSLRQGALALGSSRLQVSVRVVFPAAISGIVAACVLAISRAIGETMVVLIAAGGTPNLTFDPSRTMQTMTAFIAAAGFGDQPTGSTGYKTIFAVGATLFVATFLINAISIRLVRRFRQAYE